MRDVIAYDVLRLFIGAASLTPRGIDRVDLALARNIFADRAAPHVGILPTPVGTFVLSARQVCRLITYLDALWEAGAQDQSAIGADRQLAGLVARLKSGGGLDRSLGAMSPPKTLSMRQKVFRMLQMVFATGCWPHRLASYGVPIGAKYLNVGQIGLAMPGFFKWLDKRIDVATAMMIHDAIPILYPDMVGKTAPGHHRQMIRTAATRADGFIFNSAYTRDSVQSVVRDMGRHSLTAFVRPLPLPAAFETVDTGIAALAGIRYFVAVSTVEPRKNHELLLRVWQRLVDKGGDLPRLVIVGSLGRQAEEILKPLSANPALAACVFPVAGLSSRALASLMLGATGVLCPSLAEGFGLPLLEAIAMGVPAIASDIPAHRELANATTRLLPTDDAAAWEQAISALPRGYPRVRPPIAADQTDTAYCRDVTSFLSGLARRTPAA